MFTNNSNIKNNVIDNSDDSLLNRMETSVTPVNQEDSTTKNFNKINQKDNYILTKDNSIKINNNANRPTSNRAESYSSSTTKLNTANNSYLDLQNLNIENSNNNNINVNIAGNNIVESISTPSMMNDLMALLDDEENENNFKQDSNMIIDLHMVSPKGKNNKHSMDFDNGFIDTNNNNINNNNESDSFVQPSDLHTNYNSNNNIINSNNFQRKNSYVDDSLTFNNNISFGGRRASELVTTGINGNSIFPNSRPSISDSLDFWELTNNNNNAIKGSPMSFENNNINNNQKFIDESISQALNDYNMDFNNQRKNSIKLSNNNNNITNIQENPFDESIDSNILNSPRQNINNSNTTNLLQDFSFQPLMKPTDQSHTQHHHNNNNNNSSRNNDNNLSMSPDTRGNELFYSLYNQTEPNNLDLYNVSMSSDDTSNNNRNMIPLQADELLSSPKKKFIKPSMMLSESASLSAKLAITGLQKKPETFPTIDTQVYHHPTKIVKRKSVSSSSNPANSRSENNRRRRKSTIGITNTTTSNSNIINNNTTTSSNNVASLTTSPRTSSSSASSSKRNSNANLNAALLEDPSIKPFQCKDCEKAFRRSEHLKRHVRSVHSTDRPFPCMLCEKKFSRSDNLSQHLKTHKKHGDF
ncbi:similar to Saccharomyces cerevisiae YMR037C MSN2 Transcriptional activator related to Msn4p [Maudiozyma saulgeensis]|uniref:Similar to Saccharomyces cerevisiae YMR037C MSN2 Transcriptional activator related to Msn4p n=1 Tax=Maudiozyma saulgeensis TaxID=1789683 RepID=A0A1X7QX39_9SACH|nr:similar to Saccharomyces cerevisiae YMR037C MSN2 Transcriptional activator related to Msn4p [Kazachstania saulgeensis]